MGVLVRLRIELEDQPGTLADVASAIASYGGNIVAIDVQDASGDRAIDEMTVAFGDNVKLADVRREIDSAGRARVLSYQTASTVDPLVRLVNRLTESLRGNDTERCESLRRTIADLFGTPAVWILDAGPARAYRAARLAAANPGTAVTLDTDEPLPALGETISGQAGLLAVAMGRDRVLLVARPVAEGFTPTESAVGEALVAHFEALAAANIELATTP